MIISRTPYRVSLFGGGTDYPTYYKKAENGGAVIGFAIDKYCYITMRYLPPFFEHRYRIVYSHIETVNDIDSIQHPAVKGVLKQYKADTRGLEIHHDGDAPHMSGLGSSSSFTVGLVNTLLALQGNRASKMQLAQAAIYIEQEVIKENVGSQDQVFAAFGGFNVIKFSVKGCEVEPVIIDPATEAYLMSHFFMVYLGSPRFASRIAEAQVKNIPMRCAELELMRTLVDTALDLITRGKVEAIGALLDATWQIKKKLSSVITNTIIDAFYEQGRAAGATGGKLLGAGGGGFMLFFVPLENQSRFIAEFSERIVIRPNIDRSGSQIVLYEPNGFPR